MPSVRGLVLINRPDYLEMRFGTDIHPEFLRKISTENNDFIRQPLEGAMGLPDTMLSTIDHSPIIFTSTRLRRCPSNSP